MNRVVRIVSIDGRGAGILLGNMPRQRAAVAAKRRRRILIDAAVVPTLILAYLGHLIASVIGVHHRRINAAVPVKNLGLHRAPQNIAVDFLSSAYFISQGRGLAARATTGGVTRILLRAVGIGGEQWTAFPVVSLLRVDQAGRVIAHGHPGVINLSRV